MISPAIHFSGNCAEAIAFYQKAFNAKVKFIDYYRNAPPDSGIAVSEDSKDWVMHSELDICGSSVNMSDSAEKLIPGNMFVLNVFFKSGDDVCKTFNVLKEGGEVVVDLGPQFFSPMYGSVKDRFCIHWQLITIGDGN